MRATQTLLTTAIISLVSLTAQPQLPKVQTDKAAHLTAGVLISGSVHALAFELTENRNKSMLIGFSAGCIAGIAKELYDMTGHGTPSFKDALWTGVGAGMGSISVYFTLKPKTRSVSGL